MGVNPGGLSGIMGNASSEDIGGLQRYVDALHISFPVGMKETQNYLAYVQAFKDVNPFPIDVIVGKDGRIAFIGREYDPRAMQVVIERELAK